MVSKWILMWWHYKSIGENEFFGSETILTAHIYDENSKIFMVGTKIKVVESMLCHLSKLVREGPKVNEKRFSSIGLTSFEKRPKNFPKTQPSKNIVFSGSFGVFFLKNCIFVFELEKKMKILKHFERKHFYCLRLKNRIELYEKGF